MQNKLDPIIYVFVNKSLHMTAGKLSAQVGHAVAMSMVQLTEKTSRDLWRESPHKTIIVLQSKDEFQIRNISEYLIERKIQTYCVIDEGINEIDTASVSAMSTSILDKNDEDIKKMFSIFKLYSDPIKIKMEIDR